MSYVYMNAIICSTTQYMTHSHIVNMVNDMVLFLSIYMYIYITMYLLYIIMFECVTVCACLEPMCLLCECHYVCMCMICL